MMKEAPRAICGIDAICHGAQRRAADDEGYFATSGARHNADISTTAGRFIDDLCDAFSSRAPNVSNKATPLYGDTF